MVAIPRRSPWLWALCVLLSGVAWTLLLCGHATAGVGLMFAGGWNLSLLPVQARRFAGLRRREPRASRASRP